MSEREAPKGASEPSIGHGRVLVVDDSAIVRSIVRDYLRRAGYDVDEAEDGATALKLLETGEFDVVVTDLRMPEVDGFGVLETVKGRGMAPEVIILTGTHAQDMSCAVRALRLGAHDFLTKPPAGPDEVILTVDRAVEKKRLREANMRLLRELEALSRIDALTGLLNRRVFDEALRREVARAKRYGFPLSLAILDLDHFKKVNDAHGHRAGDNVLKAFAHLLVEEFRESDTVYRYGGEEFGVLLPHTPYDGALDAVRRLVVTTAQTPALVGGQALEYTVSAGVASLDGAAGEDRDLVGDADAALYRAKGEGRNRACGAKDERPKVASGRPARSRSRR